ncbi:MAG: rhomboid family intramembrane serine protease [Planctomycetota bacterium]|nr:rhomboid family intramembrane serine protease [Planctomycetota bacterium]
MQPSRAIPPQAAWIEVARSRDARAIRHQVLTLQSVGIASGILEVSGEQVLVVRDHDARGAAAELERYRGENVGWPPKETYPAPVSQGIHAAIVYGGLLVLLYSFQEAWRFGVDWEGLGRADAAEIRSGEWWRAITALTLHADLAHLAGNVVFGAALGVILAQSIGVGLAWWCVLLAGTLGNYANAWIQDISHRSLGASTAVFGALGVQVAYEYVRRSELGYKPWRRWVPVIMGFGLLAWLGAGGVHVEDPKSLEGLERVDIGAHGLGFAVGGLIGLAVARIPRRELRMSTGRQAILCCAAVAVIVGVWAIAIR